MNFKNEINESDSNITTALAKITPKSTGDIFTSGQKINKYKYFK